MPLVARESSAVVAQHALLRKKLRDYSPFGRRLRHLDVLLRFHPVFTGYFAKKRHDVSALSGSTGQGFANQA
jgi:hypothetical protein